MNALDFLNSQHQYYIFGRETNKTNFGGVLFLIYLIIMIFISSMYILDFAFNEKYEIVSFTIDTFFSNRQNKKDFDQSQVDQDINQKTEFQIYLEINRHHDIDINEIMNNTFLHYDGKIYNGYFQEICFEIRGYRYCNTYLTFKFTKLIYEIFEKPDKPGLKFHKDIDIIYDCHNSNISKYNYSFFNRITVSTKNFEINHNASTPLITSDCTVGQCNSEVGSSLNKSTLNLETYLFSIIYEEKKGISRLFDRLLNKSNRYEISYLDGVNFYFHKEYYPIYVNYKEYYILSSIKTLPRDKYVKYQRSKIEFLDVIANIGALFSTFNTVFAFIFKFYSKNFDNYKILEKILQFQLNNGENIEIIKNQIKLNNIKVNQTENEINLIFNPEKNNKFSPLVNDSSENEEDEEDINNQINIDNKSEDNKVDRANNKILPKLSFFDFYFNNIYCSKCKRRKKQDILDICNKIISKYNSIDLVLYNHLRLENLFKDYKWNDPNLNNLLNNNLIKELSKLI